jgi:hypothetical protein
MSSVLFVDIDDVLLSDRLLAACREWDEATVPSIRIPRRGDPLAIDLVARAAGLCDGEIVIASTWLREVGWRYTLDWLVRTGLDPALLHADPAIRFAPGGDKRGGIIDWLKQHPTELSRTCVIDDDEGLFAPKESLRGRHVVVDGPDGLLLRHFELILRKLEYSGFAG